MPEQLPPRAPAEADADPGQLALLLRGAGLIETGLRGALAVTGAEHKPWLDRILSNPVKELPPKRAVSATLMDGKGRLRADVTVLSVGVQGGMLLDIPASHRDGLLRLLDMYILRDKVVLTDLGSSHRWVSLIGPAAQEVLAASGTRWPAPGEALSSDHVVAATLSRRFGLPAVDLLVPADGVAAVRERLRAAGAEPVDLPAVHLLRVVAGVPWFASDLTDNVIPLEAGLDSHVSITKGCYPGQEVVARISNLGQVARKLLRLSAPGRHDLVPGEPLHGTGEAHDKEAGKLTSVAHDPREDRMVALGFLRRAWWKPGTLVRAGKVELTVGEPTAA